MKEVKKTNRLLSPSNDIPSLVKRKNKRTIREKKNWLRLTKSEGKRISIKRKIDGK